MDSDRPHADDRRAEASIRAGQCLRALGDGLWRDNPLTVGAMGVCSALAVTGSLSTSLVMGGAIVFVAAASATVVSLLRRAISRQVRLVAQITIIATFVALLDQLLKAFYPEMSGRLGPYVGLIVTNCIVMGRTEAFAMRNRPLPSLLDGAAHGLGYAAVLAAMGTVRELLGDGRLLGYVVLDERWYTPNDLLKGAPGAFLVMALAVAMFNALAKRDATRTGCHREARL